jgi:hypothetical protein
MANAISSSGVLGAAPGAAVSAEPTAASFPYTELGVIRTATEVAQAAAESSRSDPRTRFEEEARVQVAGGNELIDLQALQEAGPGCVGEQCLGPEDLLLAERVFDAVSDALSTIDEACGLKCDVASVLLPTAAAWRWYRIGKEFRLFRTPGRIERIAPFGNRTGDPIGRFPHYHRRVPDPAKPGHSLPGQGIRRHRPLETRPTDRSWRDRF